MISKIKRCNSSDLDFGFIAPRHPLLAMEAMYSPNLECQMYEARFLKVRSITEMVHMSLYLSTTTSRHQLSHPHRPIRAHMVALVDCDKGYINLSKH
ncbi:hypothetical protein IEQ34_010662 [Dendrobium chrysotoxum]|uniref:Uncharacterized protein n=1 Tax=Dendrobium chrysotoxum TaxID=161865 RepID=A0AAV7GW32_DENCH|nr:hypothetical protein IEQ34_010662 [Dendrobium chrysotoxum]